MIIAHVSPGTNLRRSLRYRDEAIYALTKNDPANWPAIVTQLVQYGTENGQVAYVKGTNVADFLTVSDAMPAYGIA